MKQDQANDGPEVRLIAFFSMYPEGSFSRRVSDITENELRMRFKLHQLYVKMKKRRTPNGPSGVLDSKRVLPAATRRKANSRRTTRGPRFSA